MKLIFDDFEVYREAALGWGLEFTQLDSGPFNGVLRQVVAPKVALTHFSLDRHFYQRGRISAPGRTFAIFLNRVTPMRWRNSPAVDSDTLVIFPPDGALDALTYPGFDAVSISIDQAFLHAVSQLCDLERSFEAIPDHAANFQTDGRVIDALRVAVRTLFTMSELAAGDAYRREVEGDIARLILQAVAAQPQNGARASHRKRDRAFSAALELIDAAAIPPTVPDLCKRVGASERTLRYAFRERLGVSPKQYLNAHRLKRVRRRLRDAPPGASPVQDIAARFGYWHTGQFAADYKRMFGELPSETLGRGAG